MHDEDFDQVVAVWEASRTPGTPPVYGLAEVLEAVHGEGVGVVATAGEHLVGAVVAEHGGDRGSIVLFALATEWRRQGVGTAILTELEKRLRSRGVRRLSALLPAAETGSQAFINNGYRTRDLTYFEKHVPLQPQEAGRLDTLGGRMLAPGLWQSLAGMAQEKELIERRLVLPLADPGLAEEFGVHPPRAVVLFGPPGTGKTTFAKAVASRLAWPFVEVYPSRLAAEQGGLSAALRETFTQIGELEHVVVFIDEVEEIAGLRGGKPPSPNQGVTNELLKSIPTFRERDGRLLVCATNFVRALDPAFLRHGRFDYVIPVGPPDVSARQAIWTRYLPPGLADSVDLEALVAASDLFTPADIEFAARKASQQSLESAVYGRSDRNAADSDALVGIGAGQRRQGPSTQDYLAAIAATRPTLTAAMVEEFYQDIATVARY